MHGKGERYFTSAMEAVSTLRREGHNDQYMPSFVITEQGTNTPVGTIQNGDSVVFCNFRGDRAIQISKAFETPAADSFPFSRGRVPSVQYAGLMSYDGDSNTPRHYLVDPPLIDRTSGELLCRSGKQRQMPPAMLPSHFP